MPNRCRSFGSSQRKRAPDLRESAAKRGYDRTWQRLRLQVLAAEPLCRECSKAGRITPATDVDHILALAKGGERLDPRNLQPLCGLCHKRKSVREDGALGNNRTQV